MSPNLDRISPMHERRRIARRKSFLRGCVNFDNGRIAIDCLIRDITGLGARIVFSDTVSIPSEVDLHIPQKSQTLRARVIWRYDDEIGLAFVEANQAAVSMTEESALSHRVERLENEIVSLRILVNALSSKIGEGSNTAQPPMRY
jgi:PilZ domain